MKANTIVAIEARVAGKPSETLKVHGELTQVLRELLAFFGRVSMPQYIMFAMDRDPEKCAELLNRKQSRIEGSGGKPSPTESIEALMAGTDFTDINASDSE